MLSSPVNRTSLRCIIFLFVFFHTLVQIVVSPHHSRWRKEQAARMEEQEAAEKKAIAELEGKAKEQLKEFDTKVRGWVHVWEGAEVGVCWDIEMCGGPCG